MDRYRIDSHKLMYHVDRLCEWANGRTTYPIYMEVSPSGACNHRCLYCGLDFMGYEPRFIKTPVFKERIQELKGLGLKSIMYAGEGEPFLHPDMADIIRHTKRCGIDVGVTTNGVLLSEGMLDSVMGSCEWIKVGVDAGSRDTYSKIHRCDPKDFDRVIENISLAVKTRKDKGCKCTLGVQLLLLPDNHKEALGLAKLVRALGADYIVVKPYSQHPQSRTDLYKGIKYGDYEYLAEQISSLETDDFNAVVRLGTMRKWDERAKQYKRCLAFPFWSYIDAGGNVWGCSVYLGDERFLYGNIYESVFRDIWEGGKRSSSLKWAENELDVTCCRINCRMDEVNKYLWGVRNPPEHVNFI